MMLGIEFLVTLGDAIGLIALAVLAAILFIQQTKTKKKKG